MVNLKQYYVHKKSTYQYQITASNYNLTIDSEVDITVQVIDYAGDPVVGETVEVLKNNTSWQSGTTDSNGSFTLAYTCSEWGLVTFSANNASIQVNVTGWREITVGAGKLWVNNNTKTAVYYFTRTGAISSEISYANAIPVGYRPVSAVRTLAYNATGTNFKVIIEADGTVKLNGNSSSSITVACEITYGYGV